MTVQAVNSSPALASSASTPPASGVNAASTRPRASDFFAAPASHQPASVNAAEGDTGRADFGSPSHFESPSYVSEASPCISLNACSTIHDGKLSRNSRVSRQEKLRHTDDEEAPMAARRESAAKTASSN